MSGIFSTVLIENGRFEDLLLLAVIFADFWLIFHRRKDITNGLNAV